MVSTSPEKRPAGFVGLQRRKIDVAPFKLLAISCRKIMSHDAHHLHGGKIASR
jgi:hypothetical protein